MANRDTSEAQAIIESTLKLAPVEQRTLEFDGLSVPFALTRDLEGTVHIAELSHIVDPLRARPRRRRGCSRVDSTTSLAQFLNRYKGDNTTLWAELNDHSAGLTAVINDHQKGNDGEAEFADFGATFAPAFSKEWLDWTSHAGKHMSQSDFAEFVEERLVDLAKSSENPRVLEVFERQESTPATPAQLLQVSRGLRVNVSAERVDVKNLSTGETEVVFKEAHAHVDAQGNKLRVPNAFIVSIPVFDNAPRVDIAAFLRYSLQPNGGVKWLYRLFRPHLVREEQFIALVDEVGKDTGVPVFYGKHA
jgi:uncharacterized protein YfdQ (DUF2303 family)